MQLHTVKLFLYVCTVTKNKFLKNLYSGTHRGGFQFLLILDLWGISLYAVILFGLGKKLLFKSVLGHCVQFCKPRSMANWNARCPPKQN